MRSTQKENATVVTEEVMPADGKAGKRRTRPKSAHSVKQECKQKIIAEMGQIVTGLIEKAKRGSYNEAKLLLTIADKDNGKKTENKGAQAAADASLAELLLGQLGTVPESAGASKKRGGRRKPAGRSAKARADSPRPRRQKQPLPGNPKVPAEPTETTEPAAPVQVEV
ncbi:MAG: hypothetical protein ABSD96_10145 [Candidatus Korobacteraceae bacterium]|jgi:hypothetical protein